MLNLFVELKILSSVKIFCAYTNNWSGHNKNKFELYNS